MGAWMGRGYIPTQVEKTSGCLTGSMTDIQGWVTKNGSITADKRRDAIDLSGTFDPESKLKQEMTFGAGSGKTIRLMSMARCQLTSVPTVFNLQDSQGRYLSDTLEYLSMFGNYFGELGLPVETHGMGMNATKAIGLNFDAQFGRKAASTWDLGFKNVLFSNLQELDLRSSSIQYLNNDVFGGMPLLKSLYLSGNYISYIQTKAFNMLSNLIHLDLSHNRVVDKDGIEKPMDWESDDMLSSTSHLASLDLSFTTIGYKRVNFLKRLGPKFQRLSLCYTGLNHLGNDIFNGTSLRYLDISGNREILSDWKSLRGVQHTLKVLYADDIELRTVKAFRNFTNLEILKISNNEISDINPKVATNLNNLKFLDLDSNKINTWSKATFSLMPNLLFLSLRNNNINLLQSGMIADIKNITYLALSGNNFVCNCFAREFVEIAAKNEMKFILNTETDIHLFNEAKLYLFEKSEQRFETNVLDFHTGFIDFFRSVYLRNIVNINFNEENNNKSDCNNDDFSPGIDGNFILIDYVPNQYQCVTIENGKFQQFCNLERCNHLKRDMDYIDVIEESWNKLTVIIIVGAVAVLVLIIGVMYRRRFRYFFITVKNSALLSMINKPDGCDDEIFNYDVFVSYCNEDRAWVLDHLLPNVERDCNVSVCMHERDFQVGLSILENIVSCMDRSRSIMLVISQRFLLSQWCQFEMHLAQHRLLETRREDLILILLEDIPRRLRPNTLHYLMLTKTYCQWSTDVNDQNLFWQKLKKCVVTHKLRHIENVSLA